MQWAMEEEAQLRRVGRLVKEISSFSQIARVSSFADEQQLALRWGPWAGPALTWLPHEEQFLKCTEAYDSKEPSYGAMEIRPWMHLYARLATN